MGLTANFSAVPHPAQNHRKAPQRRFWPTYGLPTVRELFVNAVPSVWI
jgi:hypothetical protein